MQYRLTTREGVTNEGHYFRRLFRSSNSILCCNGLWLSYGGSMTYNNDNYYEPADDDYSMDLQERIYDTVKNDPEYDPSDIFKWGEALQQKCNDPDLQSFLRDCIEKKEWEKLGRKLYYLSFEYQEAVAEYHLTK